MRNIISSSLIFTGSRILYFAYIYHKFLIGLTYANKFRDNILRNGRERNM